MRTLTILIVLLGAAGCLDDEKPPAVAGDPELVWMPRDAGIPPRPDGGARVDGGIRECFDYPAVPASLLPRCSAETRDCVDACPGEGGDECRNACWAGDTTPRSGGTDDVGCGDCIYRQLISCIDAAGCHAEVARWLCCIVDNCPMGGDACIGEMCGRDAESAFICGYAMDLACFGLTSGDVGMCYAEAEPAADAGPGDGDAGTGGAP